MLDLSALKDYPGIIAAHKEYARFGAIADFRLHLSFPSAPNGVRTGEIILLPYVSYHLFEKSDRTIFPKGGWMFRMQVNGEEWFEILAKDFQTIPFAELALINQACAEYAQAHARVERV
jgi:hypothetical protein